MKGDLIKYLLNKLIMRSIHHFRKKWGKKEKKSIFSLGSFITYNRKGN